MIVVPLSKLVRVVQFKKMIIWAKIKIKNFVQISALVRMVQFEKEILSFGIKLNFVNFG